MTDDYLAQAIAQLKGQLEEHKEHLASYQADLASHVEQEGHVLRTMADEVHELAQLVPELSQSLAALQAWQRVFDQRQHRLEMNGTGHGKKIAEHSQRLDELEKLQHARPPYPSRKELPELLQETDDEAERTHPGGRRIVDDDRWLAIEKSHAEMERALDSVRSELAATKREKELEQARAAEAVRVRQEIQRKAEDDAAAIEKATEHRLELWTKRTRLVKGLLAALAAAAVPLWEAGKWLWVHFGR